MSTHWAFSILATSGTGAHHHGSGVTTAADAFQAEGKVMAIARKLYPPAEGWKSHNAVVSPADQVIEPEMHLSRSPA